jgi:hypothetical protein
MQPDPAVAALANWQAARSEQLDVECQLDHARRDGPHSRFVELLVSLEQVVIRAALLLAHAVKVRRACEDGWLDSERLTSTRMGLEGDLRER